MEAWNYASSKHSTIKQKILVLSIAHFHIALIPLRTKQNVCQNICNPFFTESDNLIVQTYHFVTSLNPENLFVLNSPVPPVLSYWSHLSNNFQ